MIFYLSLFLLGAGIQIISTHSLIGIVFLGAILLLFLPLIWMITLSKKCQKKLKNNEEMSFKFKIMVLVFVNILIGVLLLARSEKKYEVLQ